MRIAVFSTKSYDRDFLTAANASHHHELKFLSARLEPETAELARQYDAVCAFVNDDLGARTLDILTMCGVQLIVMRCAGFNNVDIVRARELGITVARVPAYSPHSVAEHTVGLMLALNRRIYRAYSRVREGNFALEGLLGFDMHGKTVGIVGTGRIGAVVTQIMNGFGCRIVAHDKYENPECLEIGVRYVGLEELFSTSDIVTLHCPLLPETHHLINPRSIQQMRSGVMVINTSRGGLLDTRAILDGLKSGKIGYLGLDVYEEESELFFEDLSARIIQDDVFMRLLTFPNVIVTGHQAFFTRSALDSIAETTIGNVTGFVEGNIPPGNVVVDGQGYKSPDKTV